MITRSSSALVMRSEFFLAFVGFSFLTFFSFLLFLLDFFDLAGASSTSALFCFLFFLLTFLLLLLLAVAMSSSTLRMSWNSRAQRSSNGSFLIGLPPKYRVTSRSSFGCFDP